MATSATSLQQELSVKYLLQLQDNVAQKNWDESFNLFRSWLMKYFNPTLAQLHPEMIAPFITASLQIFEAFYQQKKFTLANRVLFALIEKFAQYPELDLHFFLFLTQLHHTQKIYLKAGEFNLALQWALWRLHSLERLPITSEQKKLRDETNETIQHCYLLLQLQQELKLWQAGVKPFSAAVTTLQCYLPVLLFYLPQSSPLRHTCAAFIKAMVSSFNEFLSQHHDQEHSLAEHARQSLTALFPALKALQHTAQTLNTQWQKEKTVINDAELTVLQQLITIVNPFYTLYLELLHIPDIPLREAFEQTPLVVPSPKPVTTSKWYLLRQQLTAWRQQLKDNPLPSSAYRKHCYQALADFIKSVIQPLGEPPTAFTILVFGSWVQGDFAPYSDVDIAVLIADQTLRRHVFFQVLIQQLDHALQTLGFFLLKPNDAQCKMVFIGHGLDGSDRLALLSDSALNEHANVNLASNTSTRDKQFLLNEPTAMAQWIINTLLPQKTQPKAPNFLEKLSFFPVKKSDKEEVNANQVIAGQERFAQGLLQAIPIYQSAEPSSDTLFTQFQMALKHQLSLRCTQSDEPLVSTLKPHQQLAWDLFKQQNGSFALLKFSEEEIRQLKTCTENAHQKNNFNALLYQQIQGIDIKKRAWTELAFEPRDVKCLQAYLLENHQKDLSAKLLQKIPAATDPGYLDLKQEYLRPFKQMMLILSVYLGIEDKSLLLANVPATLTYLATLNTLSPFWARELQRTWHYLVELKTHHQLQRPGPEDIVQLADEASSGHYTPLLGQSRQVLSAEARVQLPLLKQFVLELLYHPAAPWKLVVQDVSSVKIWDPLADWITAYFVQPAEKIKQADLQQLAAYLLTSSASVSEHGYYYELIPQSYRLAYYQALQAQSSLPAHKSQADEIIHDIGQHPTPEGWRAAMAADHQQWYCALHRLIEREITDPEEQKTLAQQEHLLQMAAIDPQGNIDWTRIKTYRLKPLVYKQLFDAHHRFLPKPAHQSGRHTLLPMVTKEGQAFWAKLYPEQPGTETHVEDIAWRLCGGGTLPNLLVRCYHQGQGHAVQLFPHIVAEKPLTLEKLLEEDPRQLSKLSPDAFIQTLIRLLMTNPEDDHGNDCLWVKHPYLAGLYRFVQLDNERAFFHGEDQGMIYNTLLVKSLVYCLDQMNEPLDLTSPVIDNVCRLDLDAVLQASLHYLAQVHGYYKHLFPDSDFVAHANRTETSLLTVLVHDEVVKELHHRAHALQTAFRLAKTWHTPLTGLDLLSATQPKLGEYYQKAFQQFPRDLTDPTSNNALMRFRWLAPDAVQYVIKQNHRQSAMTSLTAVSKSLRLKKNLTLNDVLAIRNNQANSPTTALIRLKQLTQLTLQQIETLTSALLNGDKKARPLFQMLSMRQQRAIIQQVLKQLEAHEQDNAEDSHTVKITPTSLRYLLQAMGGMEFQELNLVPFKAVLTDELLTNLIKPSRHALMKLDISNCIPLTDVNVLKECPQLRILKATNLIGIKALAMQAPLLQILNISACKNLQQITLKAPSLKQLQANDCQALTTLSTGSMQLEILDLTNCRALPEEQLTTSVQETAHLKILKLSGCDLVKYGDFRQSHLHLLILRLNHETPEFITQLTKLLATVTAPYNALLSPFQLARICNKRVRIWGEIREYVRKQKIIDADLYKRAIGSIASENLGEWASLIPESERILIVNRLLRKLKKCEDYERRFIYASLGKCVAKMALPKSQQMQVVERLVDVLKQDRSYNDDVRSSVEALGLCIAVIPESEQINVTQTLLSILKDNHYYYSYNCFRQIDKNQQMNVLEVLLQALKHEEQYIRQVAAAAIGLGFKLIVESSSYTVEELPLALKDKDHTVREAAVEILKPCIAVIPPNQQLSIMRALLHALKDSNYSIHGAIAGLCSCMAVLQENVRVTIVEELLLALKDENHRIQQAAREVLMVSKVLPPEDRQMPATKPLQPLKAVIRKSQSDAVVKELLSSLASTNYNSMNTSIFIGIKERYLSALEDLKLHAALISTSQWEKIIDTLLRSLITGENENKRQTGYETASHNAIDTLRSLAALIPASQHEIIIEALWQMLTRCIWRHIRDAAVKALKSYAMVISASQWEGIIERLLQMLKNREHYTRDLAAETFQSWAAIIPKNKWRVVIEALVESSRKDNSRDAKRSAQSAGTALIAWMGFSTVRKSLELALKQVTVTIASSTDNSPSKLDPKNYSIFSKVEEQILLSDDLSESFPSFFLTGDSIRPLK